MKVIKIFIDGRWYDEFYSGVTTYITGIVSELAHNKGLHIYISAGSIDRLPSELFDNSNVTYLKNPAISKFLLLHFYYPYLIAKHRFDFALFQYSVPLLKFCKYIVNIHDVLFIEFRKFFPWRFVLRCSFEFYISAKISNYVLTVSRCSKTALIKYRFAPDEKISVTPNAVSKKFIKSVSAAPSKQILCVSRIEDRKNQIGLIQSFKRLRLYEEYRLIFVGKKVFDSKAFDSEFDDLNRTKTCCFHYENLTDEELYAVYSQSSLFVYPSYCEGFGIPPLEALLMGIPTICSNQSSMADFKFFGEYHFDPSNIEDFDRAMMRGLKDVYPISQLQQIVRSEYSWSKSASIIYSLMNA